MAKQELEERLGRGRPGFGEEMVQRSIRFKKSMLARMDTWRNKRLNDNTETIIVNDSDAIRELLEIALDSEDRRFERRKMQG